MSTYVKFDRLSCARAEDRVGEDEVYLRLNGSQFWGPTSINDDDNKMIDIVVEIDGETSVELFNRNFDTGEARDGYIGGQVISVEEAGQGERSVTFAQDHADYTLYYKVANLDVPHRSAPRNANTNTYRFLPVRLTVRDTEDGWPDSHDEINLYYGDQVFSAVVKFGDVVYPQPATFTGSTLKVEMWEMDGGWTNSNHLGTVYVSATDLDLERTQEFSSWWWRYVLDYKVEKIGAA